MTFADWFGASPARTRCVRRRRVRHEQRAILMADGCARATGRAGVALAARRPAGLDVTAPCLREHVARPKGCGPRSRPRSACVAYVGFWIRSALTLEAVKGIFVG